MISRQRLSSVLFFISSILIMYCYWFQVKFTIAIIGISWTLLAISRTLIMFPNIKGKEAKVVIGEEIKQW